MRNLCARCLLLPDVRKWRCLDNVFRAEWTNIQTLELLCRNILKSVAASFGISFSVLFVAKKW